MAIRSNSFVNNLLLLAATKESGSFMCYDKSTEENSVEGLLKMKHLGKRMIDKSIKPVEICPKTKLRVYSLEDLLPFVGRVIKRGEFGDVYELVGKYSDFCLKENRICLDVEVENLLRFQHLAVPKVMGLVKEWEVIIVSRQQMTLWDWARIVRPTKEQVLRVLIALVGILQDFHAEGYCYNYVHPENVMIDLATGGQAPKVSVMDFDFMREIGANPFQRPIVQASQSSGTNTKYCKCFASKILAGEGGTPQTDALSMALTIGFLVSNGVLTVRSPFKKLLDWFAGCYGNESGCSMDTLLVGLNKELDNCSISEMEEWVADQKEISSLENSTSNSNDDEEEERKDCQQNDLVKEVSAYQQKLGEINDQMSNLDDDLLQRDQELASFRQKADQDKRKNDELRTKTLSRERKFQEVQEENDSLRKEEEGQLRGHSQDFRENLNRNTKNMSLARITQIIEKELSEQNENVWKSDNIEKELKEYQEANSLRTDGDSATKGDDYAEIRREEGQLRGKSQDFRENLNRNAKNMSLARITQIIEKELSEQNENVWKSDNIEKELEEYQEANSLRTDGDSATKGDDYAEIRREEGQLRGHSQDFRENLNRNTKNMSLARITQIIEKELSEQNENVWKSDNIEKELKEYQEANSLRTDGDSATKGDDYAEIRRELSEQNENVWKSDNIEKELKEYQEANSLRTDGDSATKGDDYAETRVVNVMGAKGKGDLEGKPQDEKKHLRREIDDIVKLQKRELLRREEESKRLDKELIEERRIRKDTESEVHRLKKEIKSLKQRLLAKTGQIGDTHKVVMELADLMNQLKEEVNSDD
ncbi:golgin subfamily A member 6-like protein 26 [Palaemon carinicauda]|uniref:golgin subfamily A member 6-like protein 26 n=1 Tax=Palaemon carinicauda TaxID=392227 RepID=UPI0035B63F37